MQRACYRIGGIVTIHCRIGLEADARLDVEGIIATLGVCRASLRHPLYALRSAQNYKSSGSRIFKF